MNNKGKIKNNNPTKDKDPNFFNIDWSFIK